MPLAHLHLHLTSTSTCISCDLAPEEFRLRLTARAPRLLPQLGGRVVTTEAAGALGNTIFSTACSGGARAAAAAGVVGRATDVARTTWRDELRTHCPCPGCPCK